MSREAANVLSRVKHFGWSLRRLAEEVKEVRASYSDTGVDDEVAAIPAAGDPVRGDGIDTDTTKKEMTDMMAVLEKFDTEFMATHGAALRNFLQGL